MSLELKTIEVNNYKSFHNARFDFKDFNVIVGANNAGKTNLIDLLEFIDTAIRYDLTTATKLKGGFRKIKNFRSSDDFIEIKVFFKLDRDLLYSNPTLYFLGAIIDSEYFFHFRITNGKRFRTELNLNIKARGKEYNAGEWVQLVRDRSTLEPAMLLNQSPVMNFQISHVKDIEEIDLDEVQEFHQSKDPANKNRSRYKNADIHTVPAEDISFGRGILKEKTIIDDKTKDAVPKEYYGLIFALLLNFREKEPMYIWSSKAKDREEFLEQVAIEFKFEDYIRGVQSRQIQTYNFNIEAIRKIVKTPESVTLKKSGENLHYILENLKHKNGSKNNVFADISSALTGVVAELEALDVQMQSMGTEKVPEIFFREKNNFAVSRDIISDGTLHLLAILTALYANPSLSFLSAFEEPERHLHMSAISYLMELFRENAQSQQLLITTQSSEVMRNIDPEKDHLIFIYRDHDGYTKAISASDIKEIGTLLQEYDYNIDDSEERLKRLMDIQGTMSKNIIVRRLTKKSDFWEKLIKNKSKNKSFSHFLDKTDPL